MLLKTKDFDKKLNEDVGGLEKYSIEPFKKKGSYFRKRWNEPITDIDINLYINLNESINSVFKNILKTIQENRNFVFLYTRCGEYKNIKNICDMFPNGNYYFDPNQVNDWLENIKNKIDIDTFQKVYSKLNQNMISLQDLLNVNYIIKKYKQIFWNEKNIEDGFVLEKYEKKEKNEDEKITIDIAFKNDSTPALIRCLYLYKNMVCILDITVKTKSETKNISINDRCYSDDNYKILKSMWWYLTKEGGKLHEKYMETLKNFILIQSKKETLDYLIQYKPELKVQIELIKKILVNFGENLNDDIASKLNTECKNILKILEPYVNPTKRNEIDKFKRLSYEASIKYSYDELKKRFQNRNTSIFSVN